MLLHDLWEGVVKLLFPPLCLVCERRLEEAGQKVCPDCWTSLVPFDDQLFEQKHVPENLTAIYPGFIFEEKIQTIIHALKYRGYRSLGFSLGELVGSRVIDKLPQEGIGLVPIPLHLLKLRERGYNQAAAIAEGFSRKTGIPLVAQAIKRVKNTVTQTQLSAAERQINMEGAFAPGRIDQLRTIHTIVLVDDVFTTGATMNSAAEILKKAGVGTIIGVTVAAPI